MTGQGDGEPPKPKPLPTLAGGGGAKKPPKKPPQSTIIGQLPPRPPAPAPPPSTPGNELDQGASDAWGASARNQPAAPAPPPPAAPPPPTPPAAGDPFAIPTGPQTPTPPAGGQPQRTQIMPMPTGAPASPPPQAPTGQPGLGQSPGAGQTGGGFFPSGAAQPTGQQPVAPQPGPKIDLSSALAARGSGAGRNPIVAAASDLLILFGRLRTGMVDMQAVPLLEHVTREIESFDARVQQAGVDQTEAQIAKYVLCGTADDVVQNIPGADRAIWIQYSMAARFFGQRTTGEGIFHEIDKALQSPAQRANLMELTLVCLSLGFEGKYRTQPNGAVELQRIRQAIYSALISVRPRPDEQLSPRWAGVAMRARRFAQTPLWAVGSVLGMIAFGAFFGLRILLSQDSAAVAATLSDIHPEEPVRIERPDPVPEYVPPPPPKTTQLERINAAMAAEIAEGMVSVEPTGNFIVLRMNNSVLFPSGSADVQAAFTPLGQSLAEMLNNEPGPISVVGHTDNIPLSGRGRFKDNFDLSVARANSVAAVLGQFLGDTNRLTVVGGGEDTPIASNKTSEGRALNRRVELVIQREETL
ncbi:MAG: type IVB secretion system protein IcmH/DotU [Pseudomonadota bacterium]